MFNAYKIKGTSKLFVLLICVAYKQLIILKKDLNVKIEI